MARVLTGIQSSGRPHLGNILGAIVPAIQLIEQNSKEESFIFIADFHSLTSQKDGAIRKQNTLAVAAAWLAFGLDIEKTVFYRQSRIPEVAELNWYLNCFAPFPMLANAHSFKDKSSRLADVNAGLFTYPVLMAADILLYSANLVPVGKDQLQHLEMARDLASAFNHTLEEDILTLPEARIAEDVMTIPGTDGQKMSKSYQNILDIFLPEKEFKKNVNDINSTSGYGTPLMAATVKKNNYLVKLLLENNANPNLTDQNNSSALHFAVIFNQQEIIELLIKYKANPNIKDNRGNTALDYAKITNNNKIIQLLK